MAMTSQLRMLYMGINENIHTRTSFVSVTATFCEWVTGKYSFIFKKIGGTPFCVATDTTVSGHWWDSTPGSIVQCETLYRLSFAGSTDYYRSDTVNSNIANTIQVGHG